MEIFQVHSYKALTEMSRNEADIEKVAFCFQGNKISIKCHFFNIRRAVPFHGISAGDL